MKNTRTIISGLSLVLLGGFGFAAQAAESGSRNTLKDGGGYEQRLEQAGMSGMSGMSGNHSSTAAPAAKKKVAKAKSEKTAKKVAKEVAKVEDGKAAK